MTVWNPTRHASNCSMFNQSLIKILNENNVFINVRKIKGFKCFKIERKMCNKFAKTKNVIWLIVNQSRDSSTLCHQRKTSWSCKSVVAIDLDEECIFINHWSDGSRIEKKNAASNKIISVKTTCCSSASQNGSSVPHIGIAILWRNVDFHNVMPAGDHWSNDSESRLQPRVFVSTCSRF